MAIYLRQSTAIDVRLGPFVDVGDGFTPETGVTIGASDEAEVLKANGAATAAMAGTLAAVTGCDGWYDYTASTTDTNTVGELVFVMQDDSVYLPVYARFYVVEEAVYDAMYAATAAGPLQSTTAGRALDVTATGAAGIDWGNVENQTTAVDLSGTDIQLVDTVTTYTGNTVQTGDSYARIGAAGASLTNINLPNQTMDIVGNITGNLSGSVGSVTADVGITATAVDNIWDEDALTHQTVNTAGRYLTLAASILNETTATGTPTSTTIQLTAGSTLDDFYNDQLIYITSGTGAGQVRVVDSYVGSTKTVTVDEAFITTPISGDGVLIRSDHVHSISQMQNSILSDGIPINMTSGVIDTVATTTTNTDMRGTDSAATAANLATVDSNVDAVKAKTDQLAFTKANEVDANTKSINDAEVIGDGNATPWDGV